MPSRMVSTTVSAEATAFLPSYSNISVLTLPPTASPALRRVTSRFTFSPSVVTKVPQWATPTGSATVSHTLRYMPPPGYQRLDSSGLSILTLISLSPSLMNGVRSACQEAYPYGHSVTYSPLQKTFAHCIAPSMSRKYCLEPFPSTISVFEYSALPHQASLPDSLG